jgi:hypothetical protein
MAQHNDESLLRSAKKGKLELVKEYWSKTENGNATNAASIALILSIVNGHFDVFKFFVDAGVDLNLVNNIESSLPNSSKYNYIKEYKGDASFLSGTALICAVKKYDFRMVQYLVNKGASVNVTDKDGNIALYYALLKRCDIEMIKFLLRCGSHIGETIKKLDNRARFHPDFSSYWIDIKKQLKNYIFTMFYIYSVFVLLLIN